ncbi:MULTISPECIES: hypothetical protein [Paenibacillus]|uniref:Uncharacterized protein n=1 Tax=Paenibacillus brasilensis TaxID=128574 RepID=A0ABU0L2N1_9BACL|nr:MULTISPECIES: hypothetical protein [Paenibacillus]MDQ0495056.1 hypothetical protein [Paenibacillus brasilensis]
MKRKHIYGLQRERGGRLRFSNIIEDEASGVGSEPKVITWKKITRRACTHTQNWHVRLNEHRQGRGDGQF